MPSRAGRCRWPAPLARNPRPPAPAWPAHLSVPEYLTWPSRMPGRRSCAG